MKTLLDVIKIAKAFGLEPVLDFDGDNILVRATHASVTHAKLWLAADGSIFGFGKFEADCRNFYFNNRMKPRVA